MMKILGYNENKEELSVKSSSGNTWRYSNISKVEYEKVLSAESQEKAIKSLLNKTITVGVNKKAKI